MLFDNNARLCCLHWQVESLQALAQIHWQLVSPVQTAYLATAVSGAPPSLLIPIKASKLMTGRFSEVKAMRLSQFLPAANVLAYRGGVPFQKASILPQAEVLDVYIRIIKWSSGLCRCIDGSSMELSS